MASIENNVIQQSTDPLHINLSKFFRILLAKSYLSSTRHPQYIKKNFLFWLMSLDFQISQCCFAFEKIEVDFLLYGFVEVNFFLSG